MCVDYTDLNKVCPKDAYPLPNLTAWWMERPVTWYSVFWMHFLATTKSRCTTGILGRRHSS